MLKCPSCGHDNVAGTTFCEMCGEDLQDTGSAGAAPADTVGSTPVAAGGGDIKCPACENMNPPENVVCEVCGTELRGGDDEDEAALGASTATATADATTTTAPVAAPPVSTPPPTAVMTDADAAQTTASAPAPGGATASSAAPTADTSSATTPAAATPDVAAPDASAPDVVPTTPPPGGAATSSTPVAPDAATASVAAPVAGAPSAALKPGAVKLVVEQGMTVGKQFVLGDAELQVGREDEDAGIYPDIDLADQDEGYVHRQHATLKFENDQLFVTHLGGANKTRLNNKPIPDNAPQPVAMGDKLAFGKVVLRVTPL